MRADRLIALVTLLQARGRMTATELAERLEVTVRTIYRDLDALSAAGVPVYAERGVGGGVELPEGYRLDLTALNRDEASALLLSAVPGPLADLGADRVLEAALRKLSTALTKATRQEAEHARQRLHVDPAEWWRQTEPVPHLRTLQDAAWQDRRLRLTYQRQGREPRERLVDPYGLVAKGGIWYLVGMEGASATESADSEGAGARTAGSNGDSSSVVADAEVRVYRVSRVLAAEVDRKQCRRPPGFDLAAFWEGWSASWERSRPKIQVLVRIQAPLLPVLPQVFGEGMPRYLATHGRTDTDGSVVVPLRFEHEEAACGRLLGLGPLAEVLEPAAMREKVAREAAAILAVYRPPA